MAGERRPGCYDDDCDWTEHKRLVMNSLTELKREDEKQEEKSDKKIGELSKQLAEAQGQVLMLQVKSGMWGMLGGLIPILVFVLYEAVKMSSRVPTPVPLIVP